MTTREVALMLIEAIQRIVAANRAVDDALAGNGDAADRQALSVAQRTQDGAETAALHAVEIAQACLEGDRL